MSLWMLSNRDRRRLAELPDEIRNREMKWKRTERHLSPSSEDIPDPRACPYQD
jgi:hypothetical protein